MVDLIENNEDLGSVRDKINQLIQTQTNVFTATENGLVPAPNAAPSGKVLSDNGTWVVQSGGGGTPGGTSGQLQYNNAGSFGGVTMSGDATIDTSTGILTLNPAGTLADYVTLTGDDTITGQKEFNGVVRLYDELTVFRGSLDPTKVFTFDTTAISPATTRYYEVPATSGRLALDDVFTTTVKGLVPPPTTVTGKVLSDNGTWITPAGGVVDGTYGEIVVSGSGTVWTIGASAVDLSQMADLPALTVIGNATAAAAAPQALTGADLQNIINMSMGVLQARAQGVGVI